MDFFFKKSISDGMWDSLLIRLDHEFKYFLNPIFKGKKIMKIYRIMESKLKHILKIAPM